MTRNGIERLRNVQVNRHAFRLNEPDEVEAVVKEVMSTGEKPRLLVVDTLARNFGGGDENSTKDMNQFVNNLMEIGRRLEVAIIIIQHTGKDATRGARGSVALTGAVDVSIEMVKSDDEASSSVYCRKQKDAEPFKPFVARREVTGPSLTLTYDLDGKPSNGQQKETTVTDWWPILEHLPDKEDKALKVGEIMALADKPDTTVRRYLDLATRHGYAAKAAGSPIRFWTQPDARHRLNLVKQAQP